MFDTYLSPPRTTPGSASDRGCDPQRFRVSVYIPRTRVSCSLTRQADLTNH